MDRIRQNAMMILALSFIYTGLQVARPADEMSWTNIILSIVIPLIGIIFAFNEKDNRWRWGLTVAHVILLIIVISMAIIK